MGHKLFFFAVRAAPVPGLVGHGLGLVGLVAVRAQIARRRAGAPARWHAGALAENWNSWRSALLEIGTLGYNNHKIKTK